MKINELVDRYLNEVTNKDDYKKLLKVINSVETEEHAESAERMIDNWGKLDSQDRALTIGRTIFDVYGDVRDLKTMLNNTLRKKGIKYRATKG